MIADPLQEIIDRVPEIFEIIGRLDEELYEAIKTIAEKTEMIEELSSIMKLMN